MSLADEPKLWKKRVSVLPPADSGSRSAASAAAGSFRRGAKAAMRFSSISARFDSGMETRAAKNVSSSV